MAVRIRIQVDGKFGESCSSTETTSASNTQKWLSMSNNSHRRSSNNSSSSRVSTNSAAPWWPLPALSIHNRLAFKPAPPPSPTGLRRRPFGSPPRPRQRHQPSSRIRHRKVAYRRRPPPPLRGPTASPRKLSAPATVSITGEAKRVIHLPTNRRLSVS